MGFCFDISLVQFKNNVEKVKSVVDASMTEYSSCDAEWEMFAIFGYQGRNQIFAARWTI